MIAQIKLFFLHEDTFRFDSSLIRDENLLFLFYFNAKISAQR